MRTVLHSSLARLVLTSTLLPLAIACETDLGQSDAVGVPHDLTAKDCLYTDRIDGMPTTVNGQPFCVASDPTADQFARFRDFSKSTPDCEDLPVYLPEEAFLAHNVPAYSTSLTADEHAQRRGLCTWYAYMGDSPRFLEHALHRLGAAGGDNANTARLLKNFASYTPAGKRPDEPEAYRSNRFSRMGLVNDPMCSASASPDQFGLFLDSCEDPWSTGAIGFRLAPNPEFDATKWREQGKAYCESNPADAYCQTETTELQRGTAAYFAGLKDYDPNDDRPDTDLVPPYLVGFTCTGMCHTAFNPANPPADPNNLSGTGDWQHIHIGIGNQFFHEAEVFGVPQIGKNSLLGQVVQHQYPGTNDTSRGTQNDHVDNASVVPPLFKIGIRPTFVERESKTLCELEANSLDGQKCAAEKAKSDDGFGGGVQDGDDVFFRRTFHVLKEGADGVGVRKALQRVYVNIGACFSEYAQYFTDTGAGILPAQVSVDEKVAAMLGRPEAYTPGDPRLQVPVSIRGLTAMCKYYQGDDFIYGADFSGPYKKRQGMAQPDGSFTYKGTEHRMDDLVKFFLALTPQPLASVPADKLPANVAPVDPAAATRGAAVFAEYCATCHSGGPGKEPPPSAYPEFSNKIHLGIGDTHLLVRVEEDQGRVTSSDDGTFTATMPVEGEVQCMKATGGRYDAAWDVKPGITTVADCKAQGDGYVLYRTLRDSERLKLGTFQSRPWGGTPVPLFDSARSAWEQARLAWFQAQVAAQGTDFFKNNFLSNDRRYDWNDVGTQPGRALGTNATDGHIWAEYASETYKFDMPQVKLPKQLFGFTVNWSPFAPKIRPGLGYMRPIPLTNLWASAPFLNNNSVGNTVGADRYQPDPSIAGRLAIFDASFDRLMDIVPRDTPVRTSDDVGPIGIFLDTADGSTYADGTLRTKPFSFNALLNKTLTSTPFGFSLPINLIGNIDWLSLGLLGVKDTNFEQGWTDFLGNLDDLLYVAAPRDDLGHEFYCHYLDGGHCMTPDQKEDLRALLKTF